MLSRRSYLLGASGDGRPPCPHPSPQVKTRGPAHCSPCTPNLCHRRIDYDESYLPLASSLSLSQRASRPTIPLRSVYRHTHTLEIRIDPVEPHRVVSFRLVTCRFRHGSEAMSTKRLHYGHTATCGLGGADLWPAHDTASIEAVSRPETS